MKKRFCFSLVLIFCVVFFVVGCKGQQETEIGETCPCKNDETAIKEVVTAFYNQYKNFTWESYEQEAGLEFWTATGRAQYLEEGAPALAASVAEQKISTQFKKLDFNEIKIEGEQADVSLVAYEQCASEVSPNLNGEFQGRDHLALRKEEGVWRIQSRTSQLLRFLE